LPNYVTPEDIEVLLPVTTSNIYTTAFKYKKEQGVYPSWYISNGRKNSGRTWVDMDILEDQSRFVKTCWLLSTDYLYWWLTDWIGMNQFQLSKELAKRSKTFNTASTWESFFNQLLFNIPRDVVLLEHNSRLREFTIYGTAMALAHYRDHYL